MSASATCPPTKPLAPVTSTTVSLPGLRPSIAADGGCASQWTAHGAKHLHEAAVAVANGGVTCPPLEVGTGKRARIRFLLRSGVEHLNRSHWSDRHWRHRLRAPTPHRLLCKPVGGLDSCFGKPTGTKLVKICRGDDWTRGWHLGKSWLVLMLS